MNKALLIGRLTANAEIKYVGENNKSKLTFRLAVDRSYTNANNEKETDFIPVVYWTEHAEKLQSYLLKGVMVGVSGSIRVRSYESPEGMKKYFTEIDCAEIKFLDSLKEKNA